MSTGSSAVSSPRSTISDWKETIDPTLRSSPDTISAPTAGGSGRGGLASHQPLAAGAATSSCPKLHAGRTGRVPKQDGGQARDERIQRDSISKMPVAHGGCWWRCLPRTLGGGRRRRALGEERAELLLGEPPYALADLHRAEQALVLVDPAHRDLEPLGDLLGSKVGGHHRKPASSGAGSASSLWGALAGGCDEPARLLHERLDLPSPPGEPTPDGAHRNPVLTECRGRGGRQGRAS